MAVFDRFAADFDGAAGRSRRVLVIAALPSPSHSDAPYAAGCNATPRGASAFSFHQLAS